MHTTRHRLNEGAVFSITYQFVWCVKYRRKVLEGAVAVRLESLLREKAAELQVELLDLKIAPDFVQLSLSSDPTEAPAHLASQLKGYTSHRLREEFEELCSRLPTLWSRSYLVTTGQADQETIQHYIETQKGK